MIISQVLVQHQKELHEQLADAFISRLTGMLGDLPESFDHQGKDKLTEIVKRASPVA